MRNSSVIISACLVFGALHNLATASVLSYSPDLGDARVKGLMVEELRSEVRSALLDHSELLKGIPLSQVRIVVDPQIAFVEEDGYVLQAATVQALVPEGPEGQSLVASEIDRVALHNQIEAALREGEIARSGESDEAGFTPATMTVKVDLYHAVVKTKSTPLRHYGLVLARIAGAFFLVALLIELWQGRRILARKRAAKSAKAPTVSPLNPAASSTAPKVSVATPLALESGPVFTAASVHTTDKPHPPVHRAGAEREKKSGKASEVGVAASHRALDHSEALQALAEMPLDDAIGILTKFDQEERDTIIEYLPLHPALKQRLMKGLSLQP